MVFWSLVMKSALTKLAAKGGQHCSIHPAYFA
jgi:hypothetical protein